MNVAVIGGGIVGTCVASELASANVTVSLFESKRDLGRGATAAAIGGITPLSDDFIRGTLVEICGEIFAAFRRLLARVEAFGYEIPLVREGVLYAALNAGDADWLRNSFAPTVPAQFSATWLDQSRVAALEPVLTGNLIGGLLLPDEPALDPRDLITALGSVLARTDGVRILRSTEVVAVHPDATVEYVTAAGDVVRESFDKVVIATGKETALLPDHLGRTMRGVKGQALRFKPPPAGDPITRHIYAHLADNRHADLHASLYLVPRADGSIVTGVTYEENYAVSGVTASAIHDIVKALLDMVPSAIDWTLLNSWSGERPATVDGGPIIGPGTDSSDVIFAVGHFGLGVTLAPFTAELVAEHLGVRPLDLLRRAACRAISPTRFEDVMWRPA